MIIRQKNEGAKQEDDMPKIKDKVLCSTLLIYLLCFAFRGFEYFVLRTDRTFFGEAFIHKLIGIAILFLAAKMYDMKAQNIGFVKSGILYNLLRGLAFGLSVFATAYIVEILILSAQGRFEAVKFYVSAYTIGGNIGNQTGLIFFIICIVGNIINVIMEEGLFRGLFQKVLEKKYSFILSAIISSCLFGVWHIMAPLRSFCDGTISSGGLIANILMLTVTSGLIGFKFSLLTKMTGSLYMGMGDHFVNNTIVNIFHVMSDTGADELQTVRIAVAQSISFILVLIYYLQRYGVKKNERKTQKHM